HRLPGARPRQRPAAGRRGGAVRAEAVRFSVTSRAGERSPKQLNDEAVRCPAESFQGVLEVVVRAELAGPEAGRQLPGGMRRHLSGGIDRNLLPAGSPGAVGARAET